MTALPAEIFDLDRCLLQRQSHQADFTDRRQGGEALAHPHPILKAGDRQDGSQAPLLIVTRERGFLPAALDIGGDDAHGAPQKLLAALAGVGGHRVGMIIDRLAGPQRNAIRAASSVGSANASS